MRSRLLAILFLLFSSCAFAIDYPEPTGYVVDNGNVLTQETENKITAICKDFDSIAQIAVLTLPSTKPFTIEQYSIKLVEKWKVGYKGKDNGVIFIIATSDRKLRIEVGRGLESIITDAQAGRILDNSVVPYLKQNKWNEGILSGVLAIKSTIEKGGK